MNKNNKYYAEMFFEDYLNEHKNEFIDVDMLMIALCEHQPFIFNINNDEKILYKIACKCLKRRK